jgi:hypothetical protein
MPESAGKVCPEVRFWGKSSNVDEAFCDFVVLPGGIAVDRLRRRRHAASQQVLPAPIATADYSASPCLDPTGAAAPAAILVVLPGAGAFGSDPAQWASQGFGVVTPSPSALYQLAAKQQAALAQMTASARQLAGAPIWLIGPSEEIEAALAAPLGSEQVSGAVETSSNRPAGTCSESFSYFDPGTGAKPQVKFSKSGNCPPGSGLQIGGPTIASAAPAVRPNAPRVIEASAAPDTASPAARREAIARLAELIKAAPSS